MIQPIWGYHNHINETERDAIWIDCLDSGLMRMLRTMFQEPHPAEDVRLYNSPVDTAALLFRLVGHPVNLLKSLVYKWERNAPRGERGSVGGERKPRPTANVWFIGIRSPAVRRSRRFPAGSKCSTAATNKPRRSPHVDQLYYVVEGSGVTEVNGETLDAGCWATSSSCPNWSWHRHKNVSALCSRRALFHHRTGRSKKPSVSIGNSYFR